jgi:hypothetical protein
MQHRPATHHGDTDSVLIFLGEDTHQGGAQQQQDQGVLKLKTEDRGVGELLASQARVASHLHEPQSPHSFARLGFQVNPPVTGGLEGDHTA